VALLAVSSFVALGWYLHVGRMVQIDDDMTSMKLITAVALLALGTGHLVDGRWVRSVCFAVTGVLGALVLVEYVFTVQLGIDELLVDDFTVTPGRIPGRPAEATAICLVLLALAAAATELGFRRAAQWMAAIPLVVGMVAVYGYLYGIDTFYGMGPSSTMSVLTAICLVLASLATWILVPRGVLQWVSFGSDAGAALQRMLMPVAVVLLPFGGWVHLWSERHHWANETLAAALLMAFVAVVVTVAGYLVGRAVLHMDDERDTLLDELHRVNAGLEDRVRGKAQQLNRSKTKIALFEERDRIARDLHDRVIQRIFAAGLQVASISRTAQKEAVRHGDVDSPVPASLDTVARELDLAIRELRNSIFELTSVDDHDNVEQVVRDIAARASRILGFMPRVEVSGGVMDVPVELVAQLASVIQEALSNVARHARAHSAEVVLDAGDEIIEVRVTDDGIGLPDPLPRSSGINNLLNRARKLGGTATWTNREPSGTVRSWRVPRDVDASGPLESSGFAAVAQVLDSPAPALRLGAAQLTET
jgi:signal transduction histidine kinase